MWFHSHISYLYTTPKLKINIMLFLKFLRTPLLRNQTFIFCFWYSNYYSRKRSKGIIFAIHLLLTFANLTSVCIFRHELALARCFRLVVWVEFSQIRPVFVVSRISILFYGGMVPHWQNFLLSPLAAGSRAWISSLLPSGFTVSPLRLVLSCAGFSISPLSWTKIWGLFSPPPWQGMEKC